MARSIPAHWGAALSSLLLRGIGLLLLATAALATACGGSDDTEPPSATADAGTATALHTATATATRTPRPTPTPTPVPQPAGVLDGVEMSADEFEQRRGLAPVAVMIDNHPAAAPHTGLDHADLVFEALVEGGITRYMAVYWRQEAEYIEPVRSARTPFVMWAAELQALYAHVGSSEYPGEADADARITEWSIANLDEDRLKSPTFYRDLSRRAPHNMVTSTGALRAIATSAGVDPGTGVEELEPWLFKDDDADTSTYPEAGTITVAFSDRLASSPLIEWRWDPEIWSYRRWLGGEPHVDGRTGEQLAFKNVVVMTVNARTVSEHGHIVLDQLGEGAATVYLDGKRIDGAWRKASVYERTRFYAADGSEIAFDRGPTWVEVVAPFSSVTDTAPE